MSPRARLEGRTRAQKALSRFVPRFGCSISALRQQRPASVVPSKTILLHQLHKGTALMYRQR